MRVGGISKMGFRQKVEMELIIGKPHEMGGEGGQS